MKKAVCLLIKIDHLDYYLAVSRRNDDTQWGLPGGKVDPGETALEALIRETSEEIGLPLHVDEVSLVYTGICKGDVDYEVTTYVYNSPFSIFDIELLNAEDGLVLGTCSCKELCDSAFSPFADYNKRMFDALN